MGGLLPNARLLLLGLLLGLSSILYPRVAPYLPWSTSLHPSGAGWSSYARYQHSTPHAGNHDPFDVQGPIEEKLRRLASTDGAREKEEKRLKRLELEERTETAGAENQRHAYWPAWWVLDEPSKSTLWPSISRKIAHFNPPLIIMLHTTTSDTVTLSDSHSLSPKLAMALASAGFLTTSSPSATAEPTVPSLPSIPSLALGVPQTLPRASLVDLGRALSPFREEASFLLFSHHKPDQQLHEALGHHTAYPRVKSMEERKGSQALSEGVWVMLGVVGESEGEELRRPEWGEGEGKGKGWRFGDEPLV